MSNGFVVRQGRSSAADTAAESKRHWSSGEESSLGQSSQGHELCFERYKKVKQNDCQINKKFKGQKETKRVMIVLFSIRTNLIVLSR
jgi:hypothetical protein